MSMSLVSQVSFRLGLALFALALFLCSQTARLLFRTQFHLLPCLHLGPTIHSNTQSAPTDRDINNFPYRLKLYLDNFKSYQIRDVFLFFFKFGYIQSKTDDKILKQFMLWGTVTSRLMCLRVQERNLVFKLFFAALAKTGFQIKIHLTLSKLGSISLSLLPSKHAHILRWQWSSSIYSLWLTPTLNPADYKPHLGTCDYQDQLISELYCVISKHLIV